MGNWGVVRLTVTGTPYRVIQFARMAGPTWGRIRRPKPPVWLPWMEFGESDDLEADGLEIRNDVARVAYNFQTKSPDVLDHFKGVSRQFPALHFVLAWGDPELTSISSDHVRAGRVRHYEIPDRTIRATQRRYLHEYVGEDLSGATDDQEWDADIEAEGELIQRAIAHWDKEVGWRTRPGP